MRLKSTHALLSQIMSSSQACPPFSFRPVEAPSNIFLPTLSSSLQYQACEERVLTLVGLVQVFNATLKLKLCFSLQVGIWDGQDKLLGVGS